MSLQRKKVVIVGAGIGGVTAAARLGKLGFDVEVYEKNDFTGGRCSLIHKDGFRWDQGPSLYMMPELFQMTFDDLDEDISKHIELLRCEVNYRVHFHDNESIQLSSNLVDMKKQLEKFEGPGDETMNNFYQYLKEGHIHYEHSIKLGLTTYYNSIWDLLKLQNLPELFKMHMFSTVYSHACRFFKSPAIRKALTFQSMYMGMSPYDSPAVYSLLPYCEFAQGLYYPKGGFQKIPDKIQELATKKYGAKFYHNKPVLKVNIDKNGQANGVTLKDGTVIDADLVVINADLVYAYNNLLPSTNYAKKLADEPLTSSSISFYWGLERKVDQFDVHNIFLAEDYKASFDSIFKRKTLPTDPSFYVNVPSRIDPDAAPEGKDTMVVLVPVGPSLKGDLDKLVKRARRQVVDIIGRRLGIDDFGSLIESEVVNDPRSWNAKFNLHKGSVLGLGHGIFQMMSFRPKIKSPLYQNLYFVGASTQPGTGLPVVLCGAKMLQEIVAKDFMAKNKQTVSMTSISMLISIIIIAFYILALYFGFFT